MASMTGAVTVKVAGAEVMPDWLAVMATVPTDSAVARAPEATLAVPAFEEAQAAEEVTSPCEPSEYVAEAVNCWVRPLGCEALDGARAMASMTGAVTVKVA